ncbi:MAG: hypothetical protein HRT37_15530 [Alteromonadaceae bacterium]|nr:hypothetical protein [Alteromonadaceae bacterium]
MTNNVKDEQIETESESGNEKESGLPDLDIPKDTSPNKKHPVVFMIVLFIVLSSAGFVVQYFISQSDMFTDKAIIPVEPPLPDFGESALFDINVADPVIVGDINSRTSIESEANTPTVVLPKEEIEAILLARNMDEIHQNLKALHRKLASFSDQFERHSTYLTKVLEKQTVMQADISDINATIVTNKEQLGEKLRNNERWLHGIANQLNDIGVTVKAENEAFSLVVYNKNIWGDDVYLTVAEKEHPEQTWFFRVGDITGRWKLISIKGSKAIFQHVEGNTKEVIF